MVMKIPKLNKLSQEVVNQIAAGEVVERPSSVVKELIDNSIDADSSLIHVKVKNGGIDLIEVSDNGFGIPKENIPFVFDAHTTSKIESIEDLNALFSMGFRGEALSTITSVSKVTLSSKYSGEEFANTVLYDENGKSKVKKTAKEQGTTVRVENIFYNIPARKKYLKSAQTEYRKIYELLTKYFLIYPNIHFVLEKDGKVVENLAEIPNSQKGQISEERVKEILGQDKNFLKLKYDGSGIKIEGYIGHPSSHKSKASTTYIFVNNRPVTDKGILRAVYEGYSRYIPFGEKIDVILNLNINPEFVDVNVHPRKEEVRFQNPFRIYTAVEDAVRHVLDKELSFKNLSPPSSESSSNDFSKLRERFSSTAQSSKEYDTKNVYIGHKSNSVKDSLLFSEELLKSTPSDETLPWEKDDDITNIFQIFNKYILIEFSDERLWIVDQHAAAERITFEKLGKGKSKMDIQNYLVPVDVKFKMNQILFLEEYKNFFSEIGIDYEIKANSVSLKSVPVEFAESDFEKIFEEIFSLEEDLDSLKKNLLKKKDDILATISCHSSIRSGQRLDKMEMLELFKQLSECESPYSCPHGRPVVWKLTISDIDNNFERTY
jgi:DNA mismatch repair protein MutL